VTLAPALLLAGDADGPSNVVEWFTDLENRAGEAPIWENLWLTVWHSAVATAIVVVLAVPTAVLLAHYRRGELVATWFVNIGRAIPTVTVLGLLVIASLRNGFGLEPWPIIIALVLLGLPPTFANTYAGVRGVDPSAVGAARAMGLTHGQIRRRIELPMALPLIFAGIRTATVQIIATEPLAAFFGSEGLGAYLRAGLSRRDFVEVQAAALMVAGVAIGAELLLLLIGRLVTPEGVRIATHERRASRRPREGPISVAPST